MEIYSILDSKENLLKYCTQKEIDLLKKSFKFANYHHADQIRKSGDLYITHPTFVAKKLWDKFHDVNLTCAGFLHDTIEDCETTNRKEIYDEFGKDIGFIVDGVTKNLNDFYKDKINIFEDKVERLLFAGNIDVRVLLLKIFDREHNLESLSQLKKNKQVRMAFETQAIFEPLKDILYLDLDLNIKEIEKNFHFFLNEKKLKSPEKLKKYLYNISFKDFDEKSFGLVYRNSSKIVWRVEGLDMFKKISQMNKINENVEIISVCGNNNHMTTDFRFKLGVVSKEKGLKMRLFSFKS